MRAEHSPFLRAARRLPVDRTPVWLMRQAGRYMRAYRALRARHDFLELCKTPELAAEVTLQPIEQFPLDAAIIFADILLPLEAMGLPLRFTEGRGPVLDEPLRTARDVDRLRPVDARAALPFVLDAVRLARRALPEALPLIGFAGAPFTLASYAIEGGGSREYAATKALMWGAPDLWHRLMTHLSAATADYLAAQVEAGADALQLFDSWAGALSPSDYETYVLPHSRAVLEAVSGLGVPVIHFVQGASAYLPKVAAAGGDVLGVDWRIDLDGAFRSVGPRQAVQGNLDPMALLAPPTVLRHKVKDMLALAAGRPGHIFNLGHGVFKETPEDQVARLVDAVHELSGPTREDG